MVAKAVVEVESGNEEKGAVVSGIGEEKFVESGRRHRNTKTGKEGIKTRALEIVGKGVR